MHANSRWLPVPAFAGLIRQVVQIPKDCDLAGQAGLETRFSEIPLSSLSTDKTIFCLFGRSL